MSTKMRYGNRHQSSTDLQGSNMASAINAFPQIIFFNTQTNPIPPYLFFVSEPTTDQEDEADVSAGTTTALTTQSVLQRVSSLSIMSRVSSHRLTSSLSLVDEYGLGTSSSLRQQEQGMDPTSSSALGSLSQQLGMSLTSPAGGTSYRHSSSGVALDQYQTGNNGTSSSMRSNGGGFLSSTLNGRPRTVEDGNDGGSELTPSWRIRDRMKTVAVGLVVALNNGCDPPDIVKPYPSAKLQCWMDPSRMKRKHANELILQKLEAQYSKWQQQRTASSIKYLRYLDPTVENVRSLCLQLRRTARHERVLFHYNGHDVPRPTNDVLGEIWVFGSGYSEYVPLSVSDLRLWLGKPSIVILDCSSAGVLIPFFTQPLPGTPPGTPPVVAAHPTKNKLMDMETAAVHWVMDTIVLCATSEGEWLPMHPDYPADIFTSCLTTPIQIALRWFVRRNPHSMGSLNPDAVDAIPGQVNDRKTPLGELNWIFTAVTDSIAWNVLPKPLFQRLFRQDLLVASMFRNFFLADRILRSLNCTPMSYPPMPPGVADHPLWLAWDLACETCLFGLMKDGILGNHVVPSTTTQPDRVVDDTGGSSADGTSLAYRPASSSSSTPKPTTTPSSGPGNSETNLNPTTMTTTGLNSSISSPFFAEQLTAFEVWLEYAERHHDSTELELESPEQLPVALQGLLSPVHRIRALELLRRFLQVGPWAVNLSLSLSIFPYVIKLLPSPEYKGVLFNIWACILKFDASCQVDIVRDGVVGHFIQPLVQWRKPQTDPFEAANNRTLAAFCLAVICHKYPPAQTECFQKSLHTGCLDLLTTYSEMEDQYHEHLRQQQLAKSRGQMAMPNLEPMHLRLLPPVSRIWLCICLGTMLQKSRPAQEAAYRANIHVCLLTRLRESDPRVRSAAAFALGCLLDYATDVEPLTPPPMSLGPGMAPPHLNPSSFHLNPPGLMPQPITAATMTLPTALTASAVLGGRLEPSMGQVQPNMMYTNGVGGTTNPGLWPQGLPIPPGQLQLGGQPPPPLMQPHGMMNPLQPQGPAVGGMQLLPGFQPALPGVMHPMQPTRGIENPNLLQQPQPSANQPQLNPPPRQMPAGQLPPQLPGPMPGHMPLPLAGHLAGPIPGHMPGLPGPLPGLPGQLPGLPGQLPGLAGQLPVLPGQLPGLLGQLPGLPGQLPSLPGQLPGHVPGQMPTLSLGVPSMPGMPQHQLFNQQNMRRDGVPNLGVPMIPHFGQLVSPGQPPLLMNPILSPGIPAGIASNSRQRPTLYDDRSRCDIDMSIVETLLKTSTDGSVEVRYEALMALSNFVEKYRNAFMVIAERGPALNVNEENELTREENKTGDSTFAVPLPSGLNQTFADRLSSVWHSLRSIQRTDPHPRIQELASCILRVVNESVMDAKLESQGESGENAFKDQVGLSGIAEEEASGTSDRGAMSPDLDSRRTKGIKPRSEGPAHRLPGISPMRRTASEARTFESPPTLRHTSSSTQIGDSTVTSKLQNNQDPAEFPESAFYTWKKKRFDSNFDEYAEGDDFDDQNPLNLNGAARTYRHHRNTRVEKRSKEMAAHFEPLKPKPARTKQELDLLLEDDNEEVDDKLSTLKRELKLKETKILKKHGVKRTTMLKFHSYEDLLMVCDDHDGIYIWDYERGSCTVSYRNGNRRGTRMTSSCWINEQTKSHFFVGCNDGTARIWSNIVGDHGHISADYPTLGSAFMAVPDMQTADKGSAMIGEWQQFTGSLIAGGHSKYLRVWDLHTEKCTTSMEVGTTAAVTSLATTWDEDLGAMSGGFSGMGPDLVVAGHSNGSLQLFDIRGRNDGIHQTGSSRTRRHWNFDEHRGWIVDTFFTSYGSRFEIISGSVSGDIKAWDLRSSSSLRTLDAQRTPMTALAVHKQIPFAATGSHAQFINISNLDGEALQVIRVHDEMPGHRIGPVSCLEFHKRKLVLAAGATNSLVSIYKPRHESRFA